MFGHAAVLAGRPTGFQMRAHEDTLCYRIPSGRSHRFWHSLPASGTWPAPWAAGSS